MVVAIALAGYGTLIATVVRKSLQVSGSKGKGFYRKTLIMISTLAGFVALCIFLAINQVSNLTLAHVFYSSLLA